MKSTKQHPRAFSKNDPRHQMTLVEAGLKGKVVKKSNKRTKKHQRQERAKKRLADFVEKAKNEML